jgi:hypothetical protein
MHFLSIAGEAYPYRLGQFMLHAGPAPAACGRGRAIRLYARIGRPVSVRLRWLHLSPPRATATPAARPVHIAAIPAGARTLVSGDLGLLEGRGSNDSVKGEVLCEAMETSYQVVTAGY